jgi:GH24 family phage-related lysozyme (muramidase)
MNIFTKLVLACASTFLVQQASAQSLLDNFENTRLLTYPAAGGVFTAGVANPGTNAVNPSPTCASFARNAAIQYDYLVIKTTSGNNFVSVADYAAGTKRISLKFRSPAAGVAVQLVLQNGAKVASGYPNGNFGGAFNATTTVANAWEVLTFTYTAGAGGAFDPTVSATDVDQMTLLIAPNTTNGSTFYLDDITGPEVSTTGSGGTTPPVNSRLLDNFEGTRLLTYPAAGGVFTAGVANPGSNAVNPSPTCASFARNAAIQYDYLVFKLNTTPSRFGNVSNFATGNQQVSIKFRSPAAGVAVQLVMQNGAKVASGYPNGNFGGAFNATTTVANAWEVLTFTYTAGAGGTFDPTVSASDVDQMTLLIAPNTSNGGTFYLDDITGPAGVAAAPPGVQAVNQLWDNHEGVRVIKYITYKTSGSYRRDTLNNAPSAANPSANVMRYKRLLTQYDALVVHPMGAPLADVSPYRSNTLHMTMKVFSPRPGILFQITLQDSTVANGSNYPAGRNSEYTATTTATNAWETLTFNFINSPSATPSTGLNEIVLLIAPNTTTPIRTFLDDWNGPSLTNFVSATRTEKTEAAAFAPIYPNPTHDVAHLPFNLAKAATVSLAVYDAMGRRVANVLPSQARAAGQFTVEVNTAKLAPGLYTCRLLVDGVALARQLVVQ